MGVTRCDILGKGLYCRGASLNKPHPYCSDYCFVGSRNMYMGSRFMKWEPRILLPSALARGSESRIYSHRVRTYAVGHAQECHAECRYIP